MRFAAARRYIPVYGAYVVARHVFPHLSEFHAAALEDAVILTGESLAYKTACLYLNLPYFPEYFSCVHADFPSPGRPFISLRHLHRVKYRAQHGFRVNIFGFCLIGGYHSVSEHLKTHGFYVFRGDIAFS